MSKYRQAGVQPPARCNGAPSLPLLPPSPSPSPSPSPGPSHLALVLRVLALIWRTRLPYTRCRPDRAHTLRARFAHAPHTRCTRAALTRWLAACAPPGAASRATHATHARPRGHQPATDQMYTRHCASASSTAALSLSRNPTFALYAPSGDARRAGFCCRAPSAPPRGQGCFQLRGKRQPSRASARLPLSFGVTASRVQWPAVSGAKVASPPSGIGSPGGSLEPPAPGEVPAYSQEAEDDRRERGSVSRAVSRMS